jgi:cell division protein FtsN
MSIPRPPRPLSLLLALVLGATCAGLVACGAKDNPHLLSAARADRLNGQLDDVRNAVDDGDCERAKRALRDLNDEVTSLPSDTDPGLRDRLQQGARNLAERVPADCQQTDTTPTVTETVPTVTETTTTDTQTTPTQTTTTPTQTTTTPTQTTTIPTQTATTPDSGGSTVPAP